MSAEIDRIRASFEGRYGYEEFPPSSIQILLAEIDRLTDILNTPNPKDFVIASITEAKFQRAKWSEDAGPTAYGMHDDTEYVFLVAHLTGGAAKTPDTEKEKKLHRITAAAAALANWHDEVLRRP